MPYFRNLNRNLIRDNVPARGKFEAERLEELAVEQNWLAGSGQLQILLGEALSRLPNLVELTIRDINVPSGSLRPESGQLAVSYGTAQVLRETGVDFVSHESHLLSQGTLDISSLVLEYEHQSPDEHALCTQTSSQT